MKVGGKVGRRTDRYSEGVKIGIQRGKLEEKYEVILSLFDEGFETPKIAKIVKLREDEVVKILRDKGRVK
ncbi:MAG TPA: hypothetical protein VK957_09120 [Lunatimonas sp.]|nr:hypothetical protein [Lunatimonas sp.]